MSMEYSKGKINKIKQVTLKSKPKRKLKVKKKTSIKNKRELLENKKVERRANDSGEKTEKTEKVDEKVEGVTVSNSDDSES